MFAPAPQYYKSVMCYYSSIEELDNVRYENQACQQYSDDSNQSILKMRGLPFSATEQDIIDFFEGDYFILLFDKLQFKSFRSGSGKILIGGNGWKFCGIAPFS